MKKIALILALVMMFSAVSVLAAPSVEYIFYGVDEKTDTNSYFVFGKYTNNFLKYKNSVGDAVEYTDVASDVGVYYKGNKYSYVKDGNTTNKSGLYGIAFDDVKGIVSSKTEFSIQPYSVDKYGEDLGVEQEYDLANNERKLSSNANLASVAIDRAQDNKGGLMALMEPAFDPDTEEYTIYGCFSGANNTLKDVKLYFTTEDPKAQISDPKFVTVSANGYIQPGDNKDAEGVYQNYQEVTVTAENGETKTYRFNFHTTSTNEFYTDKPNVARPSTIGFSEYEMNDGTYSKESSGTVCAYPIYGSNQSKYYVFEFGVVDGMKTAESISLNLSNVYVYKSQDGSNSLIDVKKLVIAARAYDDTSKLGKIGGTYVIPNAATTVSTVTNNFCPCGIDVTSIVKDAIDANKTTVQIAVQIIDAETDGSSNIIGVNLYRNSLMTGNYRSVSLCWK